MKKLKEFWSTLPENVTFTRLDGFLIIAISVLAGVIIGMLCSPRKSITAGCGNGPTTINNLGTEEEDDDQVGEDA